MKKKFVCSPVAFGMNFRDGHFVFWAVVSNNKIDWDVYRSGPRSWWRDGCRSRRIYVPPHKHTELDRLLYSNTHHIDAAFQHWDAYWLHSFTLLIAFCSCVFFSLIFFPFFALFSPYLHFLSLGLCVPATHYVLKQVQWWWRLSFSRLHFLFVFCEFVYRLACLSVCLLLKG